MAAALSFPEMTNMIRLALKPLNTLQDARDLLQTAIGVEFGTLPPYLYALYSIPPGVNARPAELIKSVALQEMIHMCLGCNILNALGGDPVVHPQTYPGPLPGDIGPDGTQLTLHLYPFSKEAMEQARNIEAPENPPEFPIAARAFAAEAGPKAVTIGQFYEALDAFLAKLPATDWQKDRRQIFDDQFFPGQLFAIHSYAEAHQAIQDIVSEGEGSTDGTVANPLDFQDEVAHYYRFSEIYYDKVLTKANNPQGYAWGEPLGVDWTGVYPAISDPGAHDFSQEPPAAQAAQKVCNDAFSAMVDALQRAVSGEAGALGEAVQAMFRLRMAARQAFTVPLADPTKVAGPAFLYTPTNR
jgi:hypothetical protein